MGGWGLTTECNLDQSTLQYSKKHTCAGSGLTAPVCQPQRPGEQGHQGAPLAHVSTPPSPSHAPTSKYTPQILISHEGLSFAHVAMRVGGGDWYKLFSIPKRHPDTGTLNSETSWDSKNTFLHCADVLDIGGSTNPGNVVEACKHQFCHRFCQPELFRGIRSCANCQQQHCICKEDGNTKILQCQGMTQVASSRTNPSLSQGHL